MDLLSILQSVLSLFSSAFLYPVLVLLLVFSFWIIISIGGIIGEYRERKRQYYKLDPREFIDSFLECDGEHKQKYFLQKMQKTPRYFKDYAKALLEELGKKRNDKEIRIEYLLQSKEQTMVKDLDKLRLLIRVGPTLGLMGTIIPMGPALSALAQGDLEKLSGNLIIAFTTTVVGLAIGIIAYTLSIVKNRWIHEDIRNLEYFTEGIMQGNAAISQEEAPV